jgi:hypothetical protein
MQERAPSRVCPERSRRVQERSSAGLPPAIPPAPIITFVIPSRPQPKTRTCRGICFWLAPTAITSPWPKKLGPYRKLVHLLIEY